MKQYMTAYLQNGQLMMLKSVRIENYRSIRDVALDCDNLTVLVGANGSGKSSLLRAIELFGAKAPRVTAEDYYNGQTDIAIRITATFCNLPDAAKEDYKDYIMRDNLEVVRVLEWDDAKRKPKSVYRGKKLQNSDFDFIRDMKATEAQIEYNKLRVISKYENLPEWTNFPTVKAHLAEWEHANPDKCEIGEDSGKFKHDQGFPDSFVRFVSVKPVHDAAEDAQEGRNSALTELMDRVVRRSIAENLDIQKFAKETQDRYASLMRSAERNELSDLSNSMTKTLNEFAPGTKVRLKWSSTSLDTDPKPAKATLIEDKYQSEVNGAGHGLQRIFTMCILQQLSEAKARKGMGGASKSLPLLLMIDEPELYQHPNRQRHMSSVLRKLAEENQSGAPSGMQVIYSTHSPHFVGMDRLDHIRLIRKTEGLSGGPKATGISRTSIDEVKDGLADMPGYGVKKVKNLKLSLQTVMTPVINEGFFADLVVLVEGAKDRAVLEALAKSMGHRLEKLGASVIPCGGKENLIKIAQVFRLLGIQLYCVWDADCGKQTGALNPVLLHMMEQLSKEQLSEEQLQEDRLLGEQISKEQPLKERTSVAYNTHAYLGNNLEDAIRECFKDEYNEYKRKCMTELDAESYNAPYVISHMIKIGKEGGLSFPVFEEIIRKVVERCLRSAQLHGSRAP